MPNINHSGQTSKQATLITLEQIFTEIRKQVSSKNTAVLQSDEASFFSLKLVNSKGLITSIVMQEGGAHV